MVTSLLVTLPVGSQTRYSMDEYEIRLSSENVEDNILLDLVDNGESLQLQSEEYTPVGVTSVNGKKGKVVLATSDIPNNSDYQNGKQVNATVDDKINIHNTSPSAHAFIREQVNKLSSNVASLEGNVSGLATQLAGKQDTLVSGTNIKTINNSSILGSGNLEIQGGAEYGFTGIITGTSANPTNGATLANGTYLADPSKSSSYINLPMEDGTTKKQTVQKGGVVIRTAGRLIVFATQNLMYQYNTAEQYFYEPESFVESYVRVTAYDEQADIATLSPPNNKIVVGDIYAIDGEINTGDTGHARLIFKVVDDLQGEPFEYNITSSDGEDILYENGITPDPKDGETWILDFIGHTCQALKFKDTPVGLSYDSLSDRPSLTLSIAVGNSSTKNVDVSSSNTVITGTKTPNQYNIPPYIPIDLSIYNTTNNANMLHPYTQLPNGEYIVTNAGRIFFAQGETYSCVPNELIFKNNEEITVIGYYGAVYYSWDPSLQEYVGGFFTTYADVDSMIQENKGYSVNASSVVGGTATMTDNRWSKRTRAAGINSLTITFPNETTLNDLYRSRLTCKTSGSFTSFTITARSYPINFVGDDCVNGTLTGVANKYYDIVCEADGYGGVIGRVNSYTLPS